MKLKQKTILSMHSPENDKPTDTTECYPFSTLLLQSEKVQVSVYYKLQKYCSDSSGCNTSSKVGNQIGFSMSHATENLAFSLRSDRGCRSKSGAELLARLEQYGVHNAGQ